MFNKLFKGNARKEEIAAALEPAGPSVETAGRGNNGWVDLTAGRLIAHDPAGDGRFATIAVEGPVRLLVNQEEVDDVAVVTEADDIRWEVNADPGSFVNFTVTDDEMSVLMQLSSDPARLPDTITLVGQYPAVVKPGYSPRARLRDGSPKQHILDQLAALGIVNGIDDGAIDRELVDMTGHPVEIARGQEAQPYRPGHWLWRLGEWGMAEPGQVIAICEGGQAARPRITVRGETVHVYQQPSETEGFMAGKGTRLIGGNRIVAASGGRAHQVPTAGGFQIDLYPIHLIDGPYEGELSTHTDILVRGSVANAKLSTTGEILISGNVEKSELKGDGIIVRGEVFQTLLQTLPAGHYLPLKSELTFIQHRVTGLRRLLEGDRHIREQLYKDLGWLVRALRRRAEEMGIDHPGFVKLMMDLGRTFSTLDGGTVFNLAVADGLLDSLELLLNVPGPAVGSGNVEVRSLAHGRVWAIRDIKVEEKIAGSSLYAGGSVSAPPASVVTQSEIVAGEQVQVGILATVQGSMPVTIRAKRAEVEEVQPGAAFEFGVSRRDFKVEKGRTLVGVNASGQVLVRHVS